MKMRIALLTILCLVLSVVGVFGQSYSNGPINGTTDAWTINFGYVVSDTFVAGTPLLDGFAFGVWEFPGDVMNSVDWSITATENAGTVYGSGTAATTDKFISVNQYGYNIDLITVSGLNLFGFSSGNTYWLNLQNAVIPSGDPVYWDENSGKSSASESSVGTIPSEAFTVNFEPWGCGVGSDSPDCVPEPSSIMLFGAGMLGLATLIRPKLNL
jgi:PEP-CTERM motif